MKMWLNVLVIVAVLFTSPVQALVLPEDQWNDDVALLLARAVVAEADWSTRDHAAIAWVLKRRWEARVKRDPEWTFLDQVKKYCAAMRRKARTKRHVWIHALSPDGAEPRGWFTDVSWDKYRPAWEGVLEFTHRWARGEVSDPCRHRAIHWGGTMDRPSKLLRRVNCGKTDNIFYALR